MTGALQTVAINAAVFAGLALVLLGLEQRIRDPRVRHGLWLAALTKLFAPPLLVWTFFVGAPTPVSPLPGDARGVATPAAAAPAGLDLQTALLTMWAVGGLVALGVAAGRIRRFRRGLCGLAPAPIEAQRRLGELARRFSMPVPSLRTTAARVSPFVWSTGRGAEIVFPRDLLRRLAPAELDALLAHELGHLARRDPVVRWVELAVGTAFWWHPLLGRARNALRRAEELCCDRWVLSRLPESATAYARGLVKTLEFMSPATSRPAPLASGAAGGRVMKERIEMILKPASRTCPRYLVPLVAVACLAILVTAPTFAERDDRAPAPELAQETREALEAELWSLDRRAEQLEFNLAEVEEARRVLSRRLGRDLEREKRVREEYDRALELKQRAELEERVRHASAALAAERELERARRAGSRSDEEIRRELWELKERLQLLIEIQDPPEPPAAPEPPEPPAPDWTR